MAQRLAPDSPKISWHGMVSLEKTKDGVKPWRIFHRDRDLYYPMLMERTQKSSGVRVAFVSDTTSVAGNIVPWFETSRINVCCGGELFRTIDLKIGEGRFEARGMPPKKKLVEIWFPPKAHTTLKSVEIDDGATAAPFKDKRPVWVTYGSSVTQCSDSGSPTTTWPAVAAKIRGLNLVNLGYSGECVLDVMIARVIRDIPADFLSMCVGPNIYGYNGLNERTFRSSILGFVQIVREGHPKTPFILLAPIYCPLGETKKNKAGLTMGMMRKEIQAAAEILRKRGDKHIHFFSGWEMLGPKQAKLLPDKCHPNPEGYVLMGKNFANKAAKKFF